MCKKILGLDLGSNSVGWALLEEDNGQASAIIDLGSRIFNKAVKEVPTPKNQKRRESRLGRRVLQRRARRRRIMLNYLVSLDLLPRELPGSDQPEGMLNTLGNPYQLRAKGLDEPLSPHEFGRVLLHFVARRGFLSNKKQMAGDLADDPDTIAYLNELDSQTEQRGVSKKSDKEQEERAFNADIAGLRTAIDEAGARTLGEYLHKLESGVCKRNRSHAGGYLRTDRAMYQQELAKIWARQAPYFGRLPEDFMADKQGVKKIIFYQRPLKLKKNRVGKCSLEPRSYRANMARLEAQRFRYLQDVNNMEYRDRHNDKWTKLNDVQRDQLIAYLESHPKITIATLKKELGLDRRTEINLEDKNIKGNITACEIRAVIGKQWDKMSHDKQKSLFEDLFSIKQKSALKKRLITHWDFDTQTAIKLCLLEFEPSHSNHSLKAINKLLPFLEQGMIYSDARQAAGYDYEVENIEVQEKLSAPPETANPIVNKGLHELRRVVNAIIKQYGKPDIVRIEMARDLEMNTTRYKENEARNQKNKKVNEEAQEKFEEEKRGSGSKYASRDDKIKYRLWKDQKESCAYSVKNLSIAQIFSADTEIDHILPFKKSLDDSYMNKVVCLASENRRKGDKTPFDAFGADSEKWTQITQYINGWGKSLKSKVDRFYTSENDLQERDFIANQLNDTRYISRLAKDYVRPLGCDVSITKGVVVSKIRHQWGFNTLLSESDRKERTDHRHHAIDAVVIAATSRSLYTKAVAQIQQNKLKIDLPYPHIRDELEEKLKHTIVAHVPQRKLSGALHKETGAGYSAKHGGLVYRKTLDASFTKKKLTKIVDNTVREIVLNHISKYHNNMKEAFADNVTIYHKDGKTPIHRVRVLQSKIKQEKLPEKKFGVKDKQGKIFKWMVYGNTHHVEIIRHRETGKIKGEFVTMMLAAHRARGVNMPKQPIVKIDHGENYELLMALHINDTVSVEKEHGERVFYRVQKLDLDGNRIMLRFSTAAQIKQKTEELLIGINQDNFERHKIKLHRVDAIGNLAND